MFLNVLAAMALTASPGCPRTSPGQPPPVTADPDWLKMPDGNDLFWAFPPKAVAEKKEGHARIQCQVSIQGAAEACEVLDEDPKGYGFGEAAISVTPKMLFKPRVQCGVVVPGEVQVPIAFKFPEVDPALSAEPLDPKDKKLMLAARLVAAMHYSEGFRGWIDDASWELIKQETQGRDVSADERGVITEAAREVWTESKDKFANTLARAFAANLSESELNQAVLFYEGPVGSKMLKLSDRVDGDMQAVYESLEPILILQFHQHYCEKLPAKCVPPDAS